MKQTTPWILALALAATLGAAPRQAEAGACSKLGVANGCVVRKDIKKDAINSSRVQNGSLTSADIKNGSLKSADIKDGSLTGADLADGAVGFAELTEDAVFLRTKVVSPVGPAATDNCDELQAVLAAITDNAAANPYLIYLEPGTYDCGTTALTMKSFVGIMGAGQRLTEITGSVPSNDTTGVVVAASDSELSQLSVTNTYIGPGDSIALVSAGTDISVSHVTARGSASSDQSNGIRISGGAPTLDHVTAIAGPSLIESWGMNLFNGAVATLDRVTAISSGAGNTTGLIVGGSGAPGTVATARNSVFIGELRGVFVFADGEANLVSSQLDGGLQSNAGAIVRCVGSYDGTFTDLAC